MCNVCQQKKKKRAYQEGKVLLLAARVFYEHVIRILFLVLVFVLFSLPRKKGRRLRFKRPFMQRRTERCTQRDAHRETNRETNRETQRHTHRHRHTDTHTHRHTDTQTHRHTHTLSLSVGTYAEQAGHAQVVVCSWGFVLLRLRVNAFVCIRLPPFLFWTVYVRNFA